MAVGCRCATKRVGVDNASAIDSMGMDKQSTTTQIETYREQ